MRIPLKELLEKLGVRRILSPYETQPWFHYDEEQGVTCSAEVRMGPGGEELEAEIQFLHDEPPEDSEGDGEDYNPQVMYLLARSSKADRWGPIAFTIKKKNYVNEVYDWEGKACAFFRACVQSIQMGELPNIEELEKRELDDDSTGGRGGRGKIGRKAPKIKPAQLLGMGKKGGM